MSSAFSLKLEPVSPPNSNVDEVLWSSDTDTDLYWTTEELLEADLKICENKGEAVSKILEDLEQLTDLNEFVKSEDGYSSYWMEEKMLPMFDDTLVGIKENEDKSHPAPYDSTQNLLKEFETVFDAVNNGAFTPPQSPPYQQTILTPLESMPTSNVYVATPINHSYDAALVPEEKIIEFVPPTPQPDVAHELAVVEELVRTRVEFLVPSSPSSSGSSNFGDCSSDDPEWSVEMTETFKNAVHKSRKRTKPYSHNNEDKKSRKKEQNKNAATRYRMKKKAEVDEILGEEKGLQDKNSELENSITDLQREIKYLKGLMRDLFKAKGLIN